MRKIKVLVITATVIALSFLPFTTSAKPGCVTIIIHNQSGSCITTQWTTCCESGCTVVEQTVCY